MNSYLVMGFFSFYVVFVSLLRLMDDREFPRVTAMKRFWGRRRGLLLHFMSNVALPLIFGIVFLGRGVAVFGEPVENRSPDLPAYALKLTPPAVSITELIDCISLAYTGECGLDPAGPLSESFLLDRAPGVNHHSFADFLQP